MSDYPNFFQENPIDDLKSKKPESNNDNTEKTSSKLKISILEERTKKFKESLPPNYNKGFICFVYENETGELKPSKKMVIK